MSEKKQNLSTKAIEGLFKDGIEWYDYDKLSLADKKVYYSGVQDLLRSKVLKNEVDSYIAAVIKEITFKSQDYQNVENLRYTINGIKALMEHLSEIVDPESIDSKPENPNSAI